MGSMRIDRSLTVGIFIVVFGCLVLCIAFVGPGRHYRLQKKLADEGIRATARVKALERKWTSSNDPRTRQYFYAIEYTFDDEEGETVTGSTTLRENKWRELGSVIVGSTFQVIYLEDDRQGG